MERVLLAGIWRPDPALVLGKPKVFFNSKLGAARLARTFERDGMRTSALHGDKSQDERLKALASFKKGEVDVLVCNIRSKRKVAALLGGGTKA